jgi:hypothetical protein
LSDWSLLNDWPLLKEWPPTQAGHSQSGATLAGGLIETAGPCLSFALAKVGDRRRIAIAASAAEVTVPAVARLSHE